MSVAHRINTVTDDEIDDADYSRENPGWCGVPTAYELGVSISIPVKCARNLSRISPSSLAATYA